MGRRALLVAGTLVASACVLPLQSPALASVAPRAGEPSRSSFFNPILDNYADPWMTHWKGEYYLTATTGSNITIWNSHDLTNVGAGNQTIVWSPSGKEANFSDIWSPELYHFGRRWYIYFAADKNGVNATHRDYVLESQSDNPLGSYRFVGEINSPSNQWAIDPNVLTLRGKRYFIWSGWDDPTNQVQRLFIAPMSSPTHISGRRVAISSPLYPWETSVAPINEGPVTLKHGGHTWIVYSANASWTNSYCLGLLTLKTRNPLDPGAWIKDPNPVFASANGVYGPGRASFVTSPNGKQWWMIYNAARYDQSGWNRTIRAQPFIWGRNGNPDFGEPRPLAARLPLPAGQTPNRQSYFPSSHAGGFATFTVKVPRAGLYGLYIRYHNPNPFTTTQNFAINGKPQPALSFPQTENTPGTANAFSTAQTVVTLPKGKSVIKIYVGSVGADIAWIQLASAD